ncbi:uncharacterized protein [Chelonus insularis]|uniref:uncharacterized protein n=1 Tax=Chelonus insularis TaxID=460826 RepID=UPI00158DB16D|nr:uncharacterized protein LOC118073584 [Chelonus insularis]XP_034950057.1 uncharacterized protein LOC118073584 [Chelonus insularis]XP_034950058.1 uncharacterized protein LOC118073584 [Chelonus insularis]
MTKERFITRSIITTRPADMTLNLDCSDEPLSEAQLIARSKLKENYDRVIASLEEMKKEHGAQLISQVGGVSAYQYKLPNVTPAIVKSNQLSLSQAKTQPIKLNVLNNSNTTQGNIQLVMDSRTAVLLGTVNQQSQSAGNQSTTTVNTAQKTVVATTENNQHGRVLKRSKVLPIQQPEIIEEAIQPPTLRVRNKLAPPPSVVVSSASNNPQILTNVKLHSISRPVQQHVTNLKVRPTEQTSIGGITVGIKNAKNSTEDDGKKNQPDGREIALNKINGTRTFPSLVVFARPALSTKNITTQIASQERNDLDMKVKSVLMYSAQRFAEWLIQQGLVRSEQYCNQHGPGNMSVQTKLKLAMYSDTGTFPYSGGYVWISNCCPERFVSVFSGSIFQGAPHTPSVLLKLVYHWACQTNVQNIVSWVKVSNVYVKNFYTNLRSICTAAVWDKSDLIGGKGCNVQVGVISLGTTSHDGNTRQVKVEVIGILNADTGQLRLRACDPIYDSDRSLKKRFTNILSPLQDWVHKDSRILTDFTVDKGTLIDMGFTNVFQSSFCDLNSRNNRSNYQIMDYLRKIVPRMFQNTLSLLSRQMIQQFLDELVWREMFGSTSARAFNNIIIHIAEQTKLRSTDSLLDRLAKIAANPFVDWSYTKEIHVNRSSYSVSQPSTKENTQSIPDSSSSVPLLTVNEMLQMKQYPKRKRKKGNLPLTPEEPEVKRISPDLKAKDDKNDRVSLSEFYYATAEGNALLVAKEEKRSINFKCFLCCHTMKSNTDVMQHMISHVPPRVPDQSGPTSSKSNVCRYCCTPFSTQHQMLTHIDETHSSFGKGDGVMVVCGICEHKFGNDSLLTNHMSFVHLPSEMPYVCSYCEYRTSSHKDVIDHYYKIHDMGESLQCPYCLKLFKYNDNGQPNSSNVYAYLVHMQRHVVRREQGRGNKCPRCCLWFNQKSAVKIHQQKYHQSCIGFPQLQPYVTSEKNITILKSQHQLKRLIVNSPTPESLPVDEYFSKWPTGPLTIHASDSLSCAECEEDIGQQEHYPGEQKCTQCSYITCCWRAFKEHQQQIHNERPMTSLIVPSPLVNIPLDKKMSCSCGYSTVDGVSLAAHLVKCNKSTAYPVRGSKTTGMLDSLGLMPKNAL